LAIGQSQTLASPKTSILLRTYLKQHFIEEGPGSLARPCSYGYGFDISLDSWLWSRSFLFCRCLNQTWFRHFL